MARGKLTRFEHNAADPRVFETGKPLFGTLGGHWREQVFGNDHPIILEIGCGRGEYTVGLAEFYPDANFIGVDIKGSRLWAGSKEAARRELSNVAFLRTQAEMIDKHFAPGEVGEIWITFPDPRSPAGESKKRLTSPRFLALYRHILRPDGIVHLKTDDRPLWDFTRETLATAGIVPDRITDDFAASPWSDIVHGLQTTYERRFSAEGKPIHYLAFRFPADVTLAP